MNNKSKKKDKSRSFLNGFSRLLKISVSLMHCKVVGQIIGKRAIEPYSYTNFYMNLEGNNQRKAKENDFTLSVRQHACLMLILLYSTSK